MFIYKGWQSTDPDSLALKDLECPIIIIPFLLIVSDIPIIDVVVGVFILALFLSILLSLLIIGLEICSECWIGTVLNAFEFTIRIKEEDGAKDIVNEANDSVSILILIHATQFAKFSLFLEGH